MSFFRLLAVSGLILANRVVAQTGKTDAVCDYAEWTSFKGNSPCQMWANLQAACDPNAPAVPKLDTSSNSAATYPTPSGTGATPCQCNVVAYNLMAGCSWCQPGVFSGNWVTESQWKAGCSGYNSNGLPAQASSLSSSIPAWALLADGGSSWAAFDASAAAGVTATPSSGGGFGTTNLGFTGTGFATGTGTKTRATATATRTGPFSGVEPDFAPTVNLGKVIGIPVGIILGTYVIVGGIVLAVYLTRQKHRKAWYGPTAQFYRDGGRMDEAGAAAPLLSAGHHSPNPFITPPPPMVTPVDPAAQYQPAQHQAPPPMAQYDPNVGYAGPGYPQNGAYYDPNAAHSAPPMPQPGSAHNVPLV